MGGVERIGLTGDLMLGRGVDDGARDRPPEAVWGDLQGRLCSLDGLLVNLECPLTRTDGQWTDSYRPFHFRADPGWARPALSTAGVDFASLANNHALDYCIEGLEDTLDHLERAGIAAAGAGHNRRAAMEPAVFEVGDLRVAVVAFTDNVPEYGATPSSPGVARVRADPGDAPSRNCAKAAIERAQQEDPDFLVASLHFGPNMVTAPTEDTRAFHQWIVEAGADLVHGHAAQVFQGVEVYDGAPILHDCGSFVDDYAVDQDLRNDRSFLFEAHVDADGTVTQVRMHPVESRDGAVGPAGGTGARWCRDRMRDRSESFDTAGQFETDAETLVLPLQ